MVHFENSSSQVPKPMENPRKKKAQMKTIVRVGSPEENRIRLNKREKTEERERKNIKTEEWRSRSKKRGKLPQPFYTPEIRPFYTPVDIYILPAANSSDKSLRNKKALQLKNLDTHYLFL